MPENKSFTIVKACLAAFLLANLAVAGARSAPAPAAETQSQTLDQKAIHSKYNEGDFDAVTNMLESFKKRNKEYSKADSIFIAKHLAVVYSANPTTREKGKYYMNILLELLPSAKLVDMYVSDEIDRIFEKVREEFMTRQASFGVDTAGIAAPAKAPSTTPPAKPAENVAQQETAAKPSSRRDKDAHVGYWVAGGAAVVAVGVATYFLFSSQPAKDKVYVVQ